MGIEPPYLYSSPSRPKAFDSYDFDPKAVTRASWIVPEPRPKQEGPYISFNKHPDSYIIVPYGTTDLPPLPENTKKRVNTARWIQFGLRVAQLITTLGLLVCVICIKGVSDVQGYIIRVVPSWDTAISAYAVYHLVRPVNARTPASSGSYHGFALVMDLGLVPFMVFIAFFGEQNWAETAGTSGRWRSFFSADDATESVLFATWLIAIALGVLHLVSAIFDAYFVYIFRKIAQYPPDMNPLDDKKQTTLQPTESTVTLAVPEKKPANLSGSTLNLHNPSRVSLVNGRPLSFNQSRADVDTSYNSRTPESARMSRVNLNGSIYHQPVSARASRAEFFDASHSRSGSRSRPRSRSRSRGPPPNRASYLGGHNPLLDRSASALSSQGPSRYSTPEPVAKHQQREALLQDNWYVADDERADLAHRMPEPIYARNLDDDHEPHAAELRHADQEASDRRPRSLGMHPPSPPAKSPLRSAGDFYFDDMPTIDNVDTLPDSASIPEHQIGQALTTASSRNSSWHAPTPGSPSKSRYYGNLAATTRGQSVHPPVSTMAFAGGVAQGRFMPDMSVEQPDAVYEPIKAYGREERAASPGKARVISRSGVDLSGDDTFYDAPQKRRQVSGKMAEEGMAWVMRKREVSSAA